VREAHGVVSVILVILLLAAAGLGAWFVIRAVSGQKR
jgi:hypothetical protein